MLLLFSNKKSKSDEIILNEDDKTVSEKKNFAELSALFLKTCFFFQIPNIHKDESNLKIRNYVLQNKC